MKQVFLLLMYSGQQLVLVMVNVWGSSGKGVENICNNHVFSQAYENFHYCIQEVTGVKFGQLTNNTAIFNWFSQPSKCSVIIVKFYAHDYFIYSFYMT
jgi:hypothetical protein